MVFILCNESEKIHTISLVNLNQTITIKTDSRDEYIPNRICSRQINACECAKCLLFAVDNNEELMEALLLTENYHEYISKKILINAFERMYFGVIKILIKNGTVLSKIPNVCLFSEITDYTSDQYSQAFELLITALPSHLNSIDKIMQNDEQWMDKLSIEYIESLLQRGLDPNLKFNRYQWKKKMFDYYFKDHEYEKCKLLIKYNAKIGKNGKNSFSQNYESRCTLKLFTFDPEFYELLTNHEKIEQQQAEIGYKVKSAK